MVINELLAVIAILIVTVGIGIIARDILTHGKKDR